MKENEAQRRGYHYCGPTVDTYASADKLKAWKKDLSIAKMIKKTYEGADYVIATGGKNTWLGRYSKGLFGNEIFNRLWDEVAYGTIGKRVARYEVDVINIMDKYEKALTRLEEIREKDLEFLKEMERLKIKK